MKKKAFWFGLLIGFIGIGIGAFAMISSSFSFQTTVDHPNNAIDLSWYEPDNEEPYTYKVFQNKEASHEFQSISTANLKDKVNVLNVYPGVGPNISYTTWDGENRTIPKSGSLEMWMEKPNEENSKGYGMGLIEVDPVLLSEFSSNPESYLKDENGNWQYDSVFFGSWDCNGSCSDNSSDTSAEAIKVVESFAEAGRGVLLGHDVPDHGKHPNFQKLKPLINYTNGGRAIGHTEVKVAKKGLLTQYPWNIGEVGTKLSVPMSHQGGLAGGDTWLMYTGDTRYNSATASQLNDPKINHYLMTWNNAAYIGTGHSNGTATPDEQKILANTLFYLSQLTTETEIKDRSGMDVEAPESVKSLTYSNKTNMVSFTKPKENGSTYQYYIEAKGQDTGATKKSPTKTVTNTSGLAGYSYVVDDKKNTIPDNKVETSNEKFSLDLSKATGEILHIVAVDKAGNISEVTHWNLDLLDLSGEVNHTDNAIDLDWNEMPDNSQPYTYKVYQAKEGSSGFQTISTFDLKEEVKVLNIYPTGSMVEGAVTYRPWNESKDKTLPLSAAAEMWIEAPNSENPKGYGKGLIDVVPLGIDQFKTNPSRYLKDSNGNYEYDVIFFGSWDANGSNSTTGDLDANSLNEVEKFVDSGRGLLLGHDTATDPHPNLASLRTYLNMSINKLDFKTSINKIGSAQVDVMKKGLLTQYPWNIGEIGTVLDIPYSHSTYQIAKGDVWMTFYDIEGNNTNPSWMGPEKSEPGTGLGTSDFYLTTWNNAAMIQTGHSNGSATPDEQKVLANTLFYLSQLTTDTGVKDRSGMDVEIPTRPSNLKVNLKDYNTLNVSYGTSTDKGSTYEYYVEAKGQNDGRTFKSNNIKLTNTSGLKGYSIEVDTKPDTVPDEIVETTGINYDMDVSLNQDYYIHVAAVDKADNKSVVHYKIEKPEISIQPSTVKWTNKGVQLTATASGFGIEKIGLPNGNVVSGTSATFTATEIGPHTFYGYTKDGEVLVVESYVVANIDYEGKDVIIVPGDGKWRNKDIEVKINVTN